MNPRVTDNDAGEITVALEGRELRGWSYANDGERRQKMLLAREYVEGWGDGREVMHGDAQAVGVREALIAAGCTASDGTYVHASMDDVLRALDAAQPPAAPALTSMAEQSRQQLNAWVEERRQSASVPVETPRIDQAYELAAKLRGETGAPVETPEVLERRRKGLSDYERPPLGQPPSWLQEQEKIERHNGCSADNGAAGDPIRWIKDTYLMWLKGDLDPAHMRLGQHFFRDPPQAARETVAYQRRNIGPDGTPWSSWYPANDKPTPENMKWDGVYSYEYRPLHPGSPLPRPTLGGEK